MREHLLSWPFVVGYIVLGWLFVDVLFGIAWARMKRPDREFEEMQYAAIREDWTATYDEMRRRGELSDDEYAELVRGALSYPHGH